MGNYRIVDFRTLVSELFNKFIPEELGNDMKVVEDAGVAYFNPSFLDGRRRDAVKFMLGKAVAMSRETGARCIFVQEPKPVNNVRLKPFLQHLETCPFIDGERRTRILHLSNRRYIPVSELVYFSDEKQLDVLIDLFFTALSMLDGEMDCVKFYQSPALPFKDTADTALDLLPRKRISILDFRNPPDAPVKVASANEIVDAIASHLVKEHGLVDPVAEKYASRCRMEMSRDLERFI